VSLTAWLYGMAAYTVSHLVAVFYWKQTWFNICVSVCSDAVVKTDHKKL
jgi:hypothetical protein